MKALLWILTAGTLGLANGSVARADEIDDILNETSSSSEEVAEPPTGNALFEPTMSADAITNSAHGLSKTSSPQKGGKKTAKNKKVDAPVIVEKISDHVDTLALENEVTDADNAAFDDFAVQTSIEASTLQQEVKILEKQLSGLKVESERVKKKAQIAHKRLELQKQLQKDAKANLAKIQTQKRKADKELQKLQARVKTTEESAANAKQKTRETKEAIREAQKEQSDLQRRLKKAEKQIAAEKERLKNLREKRSRVQQENRRLKTQVNRAERKAGRS